MLDEDHEDNYAEENNAQWAEIAEAIVELLSAEVREGHDFEISATRDEPSFVDVLVLDKTRCTPPLLLRMAAEVRRYLMKHNDHWCVRFFVPSGNKQDELGTFYLWLKVRRIGIRRSLGKVCSANWNSQEDFFRALWGSNFLI